MESNQMENQRVNAYMCTWGGDFPTLYVHIGETTFYVTLKTHNKPECILHINMRIQPIDGETEQDLIDDEMLDNERYWTLVLESGNSQLFLRRNAGETSVKLCSENADVDVSITEHEAAKLSLQIQMYEHNLFQRPRRLNSVLESVCETTGQTQPQCITINNSR